VTAPRVRELVVTGPRVAAWSGPPPLRVVPALPPPPEPPHPPERFAGRGGEPAYQRHRLRVAVAQIRGTHPKLTAEEATVEALARQRWRQLHPGTCVGNGLLLAEHFAAQRVRDERAARRRRPEERNLRRVVREAVRRRDETRAHQTGDGPRALRRGWPTGR
jgi:hypothetical protein